MWIAGSCQKASGNICYFAHSYISGTMSVSVLHLIFLFAEIRSFASVNSAL